MFVIATNWCCPCKRTSHTIPHHTNPPTPSLPPHTDIDVYAPAAGESTLLITPLSNLHTRLTTLLQEWEDNPLLLQLVAIVQRLGAMGPDTPLKVLMTGLELLITRAQVWWAWCWCMVGVVLVYGGRVWYNKVHQRVVGFVQSGFVCTHTHTHTANKQPHTHENTHYRCGKREQQSTSA